MTYDFRDRVAIVTGGYSGIGAGIAEAFAQRGVHLVLVARNEKALAAYQRHLETNYSASVETYAADVSTKTDVRGLIGFVKKHFSRPDILVNAAGIYRRDSQPNMTDALTSLASVNLFSKYNTCAAALPLLRAGSASRIINISSTAAFTSFPDTFAYGFVMRQVAEYSAALDEHERPRVRVLCMAPGIVDTPLARTEFRDLVRERYAAQSPSISFETYEDDFWHQQWQISEIGEQAAALIANPPDDPIVRIEGKIVL